METTELNLIGRNVKSCFKIKKKTCRMVDIVIHVKSELELTMNEPCNTVGRVGVAKKGHLGFNS